MILLFLFNILSALDDIGPFAASMIRGALILAAFSSVITNSIAAGIKISASASRSSGPLSVNPG